MDFIADDYQAIGAALAKLEGRVDIGITRSFGVWNTYNIPMIPVIYDGDRPSQCMRAGLELQEWIQIYGSQLGQSS